MARRVFLRDDLVEEVHKQVGERKRAEPGNEAIDERLRRRNGHTGIRPSNERQGEE